MRSQTALPFPCPVPPPAEPPGGLVHPRFRALRESLSEALNARLSSGAELVHFLQKKRRPAVQTMLAPLDRVLGGGIARGQLVEISGRRSSGRFGICLAALAAVTSSGEAAALVDLGDHLDPQLAEAAGIELPRLLWVRPQNVKQAMSAAEMLITTGFPLVVLDLGVRMSGRRVAEASWVRLARSAEGYGAALLVSSPFHISGTAAAAIVSTHSGSPVWKGKGKSPRLLLRIDSMLTLERHRRIITGHSEQLRLRYEEAIVAPDAAEEMNQSQVEKLAAVSA